MPLTDQLTKKIVKGLGITILSVIALYLSFILFDILIVLSVSILLAMIFHPIVNFFEKQGLNRLTAVLFVFGASTIFLFFGLSVLIPKIARQMNTLASTLSQDNVNAVLSQAREYIENYFPFLNAESFIEQLGEFISDLFFNSINNLSAIVSSIFSVIAILVIVPFMTFFLVKDNQQIVKGIINIMPNKYFEMSYAITKKISIDLGRFVRGWIFDAFLVGFLSALGLTILGIQNSITIGFIAGIGHLIPYFGPIIGGIPAVIISLIQFGDLSMLPNITIMFVLIYTLDNGFIQPNVFSKSTDMHPLMIIVLILVGSKIMGIFGMLLAVPLATVIKTAAREIYFGFKKYRIIKL